MLIGAITFAGVLAAILAAYWIFVVGPESREQGTLKSRLKADAPARASRVLPLLKQPERLSSIPILNAALGHSGYVSTQLKKTIDRSGLPLTVGRFLLLSGTVALAAYLLTDFYTRLWWLGVAAMAIASLIPLMVVRYFGTKRIRKFEEQFPEAIDLIARAMRAGHAFATGLKIAADELPEPAGIEFRKLYERQSYGAQLPESLKVFADRIPSLDARFFVTAVLTQRETGGNLAEVLDRLASVMRERFRIRRDVRVRSAHGRMTAYILAALPPTMAILLMLSSPAEFKVLITDPLGIHMLEAAVALQVTGVLVVRKLIDIEY